MAILDWVVKLEGRILERPPMRDFWSLESHDVPERPGVYILIGRPGLRFKYPGGDSPVFYIGQSKNLRRRLKVHLKWSTSAYHSSGEVPYWPRYEYAAAYGGRYAYIRTWQGMTPKDLEDAVMAHFALTYRSFPLANGQGAWRRVGKILKEKQRVLR